METTLTTTDTDTDTDTDTVAIPQPQPLPTRTLYCRWDTCDITSVHAKYLKEQSESATPDDEFHAENKGKTDAEFFQLACEDDYVITEAWKDLLYMISDLMVEMETSADKRGGNYSGWRIKVDGFGWRGVSGAKVAHTADPAELLREILPKCECTFNVFRCEDEVSGVWLEIQNFHHDSCTGKEWYTVEVNWCDEEEVEEDEEE